MRRTETVRVINRLSFRNKDNPLYSCAVWKPLNDSKSAKTDFHVYMVVPFTLNALSPIQSRRTHPSGTSRCMGEMQRAFLIQVIISHVKNLSRSWNEYSARRKGSRLPKASLRIHVCKGDIPLHSIRKWVDRGDSIWMDDVPDPLFPSYLSVDNDRSVIHRVRTLELVDWKEPNSDAQATLDQFCNGPLERSPYSSLDPLKTYAIEYMNNRYSPNVHSFPKRFKNIFETECLFNSFELDSRLMKPMYITAKDLGYLLGEHKRLTSKMKKSKRSFPFIPTDITVQKLIENAIKGSKALCRVWKKPNTSPAARWGSSWDPSVNKTADQGMYCCITTQLSPWLSVGAISPRTIWRIVMSIQGCRSPKTENDSLLGQLLWREAFHAIGHASLVYSAEKKALRVSFFWNHPDRFSPLWYKATSQPFLSNGGRKYDKFQKWIRGKLGAGDGPPFRATPDDTNRAMHQLVETGWIHHLQRHLVASVLTRPRNKDYYGLGIHWMLGESVFRMYLLDHDASINRCNYMWLAAVAFSSKLKSPQYAYREDDYIQRRIARCVKNSST